VFTQFTQSLHSLHIVYTGIFLRLGWKSVVVANQRLVIDGSGERLFRVMNRRVVSEVSPSQDSHVKENVIMYCYIVSKSYESICIYIKMVT
jgi:hypothetical protein